MPLEHWFISNWNIQKPKRNLIHTRRARVWTLTRGLPKYLHEAKPKLHTNWLEAFTFTINYIMTQVELPPSVWPAMHGQQPLLEPRPTLQEPELLVVGTHCRPLMLRRQIHHEGQKKWAKLQY